MALDNNSKNEGHGELPILPILLLLVAVIGLSVSSCNVLFKAAKDVHHKQEHSKVEKP